MSDTQHIILNLIILWIGIGIWIGNRKIQKEIKNAEPTLSDYLYRLHLILDKSEYEIFKMVAIEASVYSYDDHFKQYVKDGSMPAYMVDFLEEGKPYIKDCKIKTWVW